MEIRITTNQILKFLEVLSWIIFIGLCIEAGGIAFSAFYTCYINPINAKTSWEGMDLTSLYNFDRGYFLVEMLVMFIISVLKAIMFYLIVKLFWKKNLHTFNLFSNILKNLILSWSLLALGIALFSECGYNSLIWLESQGVILDKKQLLSFAGSDIWLFMSVILFLIAQVVKKGIEIQNENDLTI